VKYAKASIDFRTTNNIPIDLALHTGCGVLSAQIKAISNLLIYFKVPAGIDRRVKWLIA
jgi:hypothetical protein